jgi:hypothetical protein
MKTANGQFRPAGQRGNDMLSKKFLGVMLLGAAAATASSTAFAAGDRDFNTAAGAVLGAAIGSQNGSGGALVGGLVGAAVGNAISSDRHYGGRGYVSTRVYAQPAPVYYEPAPVYYEAPRRYYYAPAPVYVEPRPVYLRCTANTTAPATIAAMAGVTATVTATTAKRHPRPACRAFFSSLR